MTAKVQALFESFSSSGSIKDLGSIIDKVRDVYDLDHVVYYAVTLGHGFVLTSGAGELDQGAGFWRREASSLAALTYPGEWVRRYQEEGYGRIDPTLKAAAQSFMPVDWKRIPWDNAKKRQFLREAVEAGVGNQGLTVPVRGPNGQFAAFTINKSCDDLEWERYRAEHLGDLLVISHFFHQKVLEFENVRDHHAATDLSGRERDVLTLIAQGRSRGQAAADLHISENTVRVYLDSARFKLGALNIPHAVAIAAGRGLLSV